MLDASWLMAHDSWMRPAPGGAALGRDLAPGASGPAGPGGSGMWEPRPWAGSRPRAAPLGAGLGHEP